MSLKINSNVKDEDAAKRLASDELFRLNLITGYSDINIRPTVNGYDISYYDALSNRQRIIIRYRVKPKFKAGDIYLVPTVGGYRAKFIREDGKFVVNLDNMPVNSHKGQSCENAIATGKNVYDFVPKIDPEKEKRAKRITDKYPGRPGIYRDLPTGFKNGFWDVPLGGTWITEETKTVDDVTHRKRWCGGGLIDLFITPTIEKSRRDAEAWTKLNRDFHDTLWSMEYTLPQIERFKKIAATAAETTPMDVSAAYASILDVVKQFHDHGKNFTQIVIALEGIYGK